MDESRAPPAESSAWGRRGLLSVSLLPMVAQPLLLGTDGPLPLLQDLLVLCMLLIRPPLPSAESPSPLLLSRASFYRQLGDSGWISTERLLLRPVCFMRDAYPIVPHTLALLENRGRSSALSGVILIAWIG
jgi:hypothetical protein